MVEKLTFPQTTEIEQLGGQRSTSNFHAKWCPESSHSCSAHNTKQWISKWLDEQGWRA